MKNKILRLVTLIASFVCPISIASIEVATNELIPVLWFVVSLGWLVAFGYANRYRFAGVKE